MTGGKTGIASGRAAPTRLGLALAALGALIACTPTEEIGDGQGGPLPPDEIEVARASHAGFETVEVVCDLPNSQLGARVETSPEKGRAAYTLYDTAPTSQSARAFHITGFADGCPRRVTAALAMFGSVEVYELTHFSGLVAPPDAATDRAYAALRSPHCGRDGPCTGNGLRKLTRDTAFLSAFPRAGSSARLELLMHDGTLAATARK